jgi:hypothetical protein
MIATDMSASTTTTGRAVQAARHAQEVLMGQTVPRQHPAVVLRSHFNQLRALLAVALIAVTGLTVAVVILASTDKQVSDTSSAAPIGHLNYGEFNPATGRPQAAPLPRTRPDGGPEESVTGAAIGSASGRGVITGSRSDSLPREEHPLRSRVGTARPDGPPDGGPKDYSKNSATGDIQRSQPPGVNGAGARP